MAPSPIAVAACGVAGVADRIARQAVAREGLRAIEVSPPPGMKLRPKPSGSGARRAAPPSRPAGRTASAIIGVVVTRRRNGSHPSAAALSAMAPPIEWARAKCGSGMKRDQHAGRAPRRGPAGNRRNAAHGPCGGCAPAGSTGPGRASRRPPPRSRATSRSPTVSKYFSMNSARPWRRQTVPWTGPSGTASGRRAACRPSLVGHRHDDRVARNRIVGRGMKLARRSTPAGVRTASVIAAF